MINEKIFNRNLNKHKRDINILGSILFNNGLKTIDEKNRDFFVMIIKSAEELALARSEFKCNKCSSEDYLTVHHLIMRKSKRFIPFWQYITQRYYWANICILCKKCHIKYHDFVEDDKEEKMLYISKEKIDILKNKYLGEEILNEPKN